MADPDRRAKVPAAIRRFAAKNGKTLLLIDRYHRRIRNSEVWKLRTVVASSDRTQRWFVLAMPSAYHSYSSSDNGYVITLPSTPNVVYRATDSLDQAENWYEWACVNVLGKTNYWSQGDVRRWLEDEPDDP